MVNLSLGHFLKCVRVINSQLSYNTKTINNISQYNDNMVTSYVAKY